jgi:hypothetical protein
LGALRERSLALGVEGCDGQLELLLDLGVGKRLKRLESFASSRIDGGNGHDLSSLEIVWKEFWKFSSPYCLPGPEAKGNRSGHTTIPLAVAELTAC